MRGSLGASGNEPVAQNSGNAVSERFVDKDGISIRCPWPQQADIINTRQGVPMRGPDPGGGRQGGARGLYLRQRQDDAVGVTCGARGNRRRTKQSHSKQLNPGDHLKFD